MATVILHPAMKPERNFFEPPIVIARAPNGENDVQLIVSKTTIAEFAKAHRRTPLFEAWVHLVGEMPPVNNAYHYPQTIFPNAVIRSLKDAHACFKGVKRPLNQEDDGEEVCVYVIATPQTVRWKSDMACVAAIVDCPTNAVFTVHVRSAASLQMGVSDVWGAITKWEFVNADAERPTLPENYTERYGELLWERD